MGAMYLLQFREPDGMRSAGCFKRLRQGWTRWRTYGQYPTSMEAFCALESAMKVMRRNQYRVVHRGGRVLGLSNRLRASVRVEASVAYRGTPERRVPGTGAAGDTGGVVVRITAAGAESPLAASRTAMRLLASNGRRGFDWGCMGARSAALAHSLICDATGNGKIADRLYRDFQREVVQRMRQVRFKMNAEFIHAWCAGRVADGGTAEVAP